MTKSNSSVKKLVSMFVAIILICSCSCISASAASLKKPTLKSVKAISASSITVKWKKATKAKGYVVYQKKAGNKSYKKISTINNKNKTTYIVNKLKSETKYSYKIKSYTKKGNKIIYSTFSNVKSATTKHAHKYTKYVCECGDVIYTCKCGKTKVVKFKDENLEKDEIKCDNFSQTGMAIILDDVDKSETEIALTGTPNSVVKSYGKNLLKQSLFSIGNYGLSVTLNGDGTILLNGTATSNGNLYLSGNGVDGSGENPFYGFPVGITLKGLNLVKSGTIDTTNAIVSPSFNYKVSSSESNLVLQRPTVSKTFELTESMVSSEKIRGIWYNFAKGTVFADVVLQPMIILADETDETYEKYKDPISVTLDSQGKGKIDFSGEKMYLYSSDEFTATYEIDSQKTDLVKSGLYKKSIVLNGDSICAGGSTRVSFGKQLADKYEMSINNKSVGGATIAYGTTSSGTNRHWVCNTISNMPSKADYVLLEGGINDYWNNVELGRITQTTTEDVDNTTFYGALESICRQAKDKWTNSKIIFITSHKIQTTSTRKNDIGYTFDEYHSAIIEVCNKYSIPVCDIYSLSEFDTSKTEYLQYTSDDNNDGIRDGVHPTTQGYEMFYVPLIEQTLKNLTK